uniref:(northern house mosquito) hypothetical protein n=1 Tax=Culex pipiens TaxID=7175 RepID=A0A8D8KJX2_CULPI
MSRSLTWDLARFYHPSVQHGSPDGTGLRPTVTAVNIVNLNKYKYGNKRLVLRYTSFKPRVLISGNHLDGQNWRSGDSTGVRASTAGRSRHGELGWGFTLPSLHTSYRSFPH